MNSLKRLQRFHYNNVLDTIGVDLEVTDQFPGNSSPKLLFEYTRSNHWFGLQMGGFSTGARLSYADYSGEILIDQYSKMRKLSLYYSYEMFGRKLSYFLGAGLTFSRSSMDLLSHVQYYVARDEYHEEFTFRSGQTGLYLLFKTQYVTKGGFVVFADAGMLAQFIDGDMKEVTTGELLVDPDAISDVFTHNWTGIRAGIGIGYMINRVKE